MQGRIERLALLSLTDLARVSCADENTERANTLTNAARRYLFALAALAEGHSRATGSHRLRSGCELVHAGESAVTVDLRGNVSSYLDADALKKLFVDRELLVQIAASAKTTLEIPDSLADFTVTPKASAPISVQSPHLSRKPWAGLLPKPPRRPVGEDHETARHNLSICRA